MFGLGSQQPCTYSSDPRRACNKVIDEIAGQRALPAFLDAWCNWTAEECRRPQLQDLWQMPPSAANQQQSCSLRLLPLSIAPSMQTMRMRGHVPLLPEHSLHQNLRQTNLYDIAISSHEARNMHSEIGHELQHCKACWMRECNFFLCMEEPFQKSCNDIMNKYVEADRLVFQHVKLESPSAPTPTSHIVHVK